MERKLKMKIGQAATTVSTNTINAEKIHAALPEGHKHSVGSATIAMRSLKHSPWQPLMEEAHARGRCL